MAHVAQEKLIEYIKENQEKLYRIAYTYTKNQEKALDVVQEAITKSLENINKLRHEEYVKTWFYRILLNEAIKASKNDKTFVDYDSVEKELHINSHENELVEKIDIYETIQKLNEKLKTVIILRFFWGCTLDETSNILQMPVGTVSTKQRKALDLLRLDLGKEEEV